MKAKPTRNRIEKAPATTAVVREIREIVRCARVKAFEAVNFAMVEAYWLIGKRIVEEEQQGRARAQYGQQLIHEVSQ